MSGEHLDEFGILSEEDWEDAIAYAYTNCPEPSDN